MKLIAQFPSYDEVNCLAGNTKLVAPILMEQADIVRGDRGVRNENHFSLFKRLIQMVGTAKVSRPSNIGVTMARAYGQTSRAI